jgi:hypothetical protein
MGPMAAFANKRTPFSGKNGAYFNIRDMEVNETGSGPVPFFIEV